MLLMAIPEILMPMAGIPVIQAGICPAIACLDQDGAGTIMDEIISSLREDSEGGGGHTKDSMISSVVFISDARSGGSVLDDLLATNISEHRESEDKH